MKKKLISLLLAGGMILSMAACGNSDQEVSQSQTGGSESSATGSSEAAGGSETAGSSEASAPADDFTYPMEPVTFTFNGSGSGGTAGCHRKELGKCGRLLSGNDPEVHCRLLGYFRMGFPGEHH